MRRLIKNSNQKGFTILELMIATTILSTILVLVTVMMINVGSLYYKGINEARIQDDVRSITDEVSQRLQINNITPSSGTANYWIVSVWPPTRVTANAYCIGNTRYSYILGSQIGSGRDTDGSAQIAHALWRDPIASGAVCTPADITQPTPTANGTELVAPNSRLTAFCIGDYVAGSCVNGTTSPYQVSVGIAYGNIDLMQLSLSGPNATRCLGNKGDQFCATAGLTTTATQRL